tara:strand:+ start:13545 stop:14228 length:684 start_codon:yes stop_codon:yes gene_type:complete
MNSLLNQIQIQVNSNIYLKDPTSSELGKSIISNSIDMIGELGLEHFTFRKLAQKLTTTESSIYRYFENKNKLLVYLTSWYWSWLEYQIAFITSNISDPSEKLQLAIIHICSVPNSTDKHGDINMLQLHNIVVSESSKAYLLKEVDDCNKEGFYVAYKRLTARLSNIVLEINPDFKFSKTLISTIIEGIQHQKYFSSHLPSLTDISESTTPLGIFYSTMALSTIKKSA